jgi:hypothetical protein
MLFWLEEKYINSLDIDNFGKDIILSLSGAKPSLCNSSVSGWFEWFRDAAFFELDKHSFSDDESNHYIRELAQVSAPSGDIGYITGKGAAVDAAFALLVLLDRIVVANQLKLDGWEYFVELHGIYECISHIGYGLPEEGILRHAQSRAAKARHSEHYELKEQALEHYREHIDRLSKGSRAAAARELASVVPLKPRTLEALLKENGY